MRLLANSCPVWHALADNTVGSNSFTTIIPSFATCLRTISADLAPHFSACCFMICRPWQTDSNLLNDIIDSIQDSWNVLLKPNEDQRPTCTYSDYYCPKSVLFELTTPTIRRTPIRYGAHHKLSIDDSTVTLTVSANMNFTVGKVHGEMLELSIADILVYMFQTDDMRYFVNNRLNFVTVCQQSSSNYSIDIGVPVSLYPPEYRFDISFWQPGEGYTIEQYISFVYRRSRHLVRDVTLIDTFACDTKTSHCFSIVYQSLEVALSYSTAYSYYQCLREQSESMLGCVLR